MVIEIVSDFDPESLNRVIRPVLVRAPVNLVTSCLSDEFFRKVQDLPLRADALHERIMAGSLRQVDIALTWRDLTQSDAEPVSETHSIGCDVFEGAPPLATRASRVWQQMSDNRLVVPADIAAASAELDVVTVAADELLAQAENQADIHAAFPSNATLEARQKVLEAVPLLTTRSYLKAFFEEATRLVDAIDVFISPPSNQVRQDWFLQRRLMQ